MCDRHWEAIHGGTDCNAKKRKHKKMLRPKKRTLQGDPSGSSIGSQDSGAADSSSVCYDVMSPSNVTVSLQPKSPRPPKNAGVSYATAAESLGSATSIDNPSIGSISTVESPTPSLAESIGGFDVDKMETEERRALVRGAKQKTKRPTPSPPPRASLFVSSITMKPALEGTSSARALIFTGSSHRRNPLPSLDFKSSSFSSWQLRFSRNSREATYYIAVTTSLLGLGPRPRVCMVCDEYLAFPWEGVAEHAPDTE